MPANRSRAGARAARRSLRRIVIVFLSTVTAVVLLFSYHTSTNSGADEPSAPAESPESPSSPASPESPSSPAAPGLTAAPGPAPPPGPAPSPGSPKPGGSPTATSTPSPIRYTGDTAGTEWGPVQVRITVQGGKILTSVAVRHPQGNRRDAQINARALPILNREAVRQQSASIDTVSGATVTSDGYKHSLQSAIDKAHL